MTPSDKSHDHASRVELLKEMKQSTDILLSAIRVDDVEILEQALADREAQMKRYESLAAGTTPPAEDPVLRTLLEEIAALDLKARTEFEAMKGRIQAAADASRKKTNVLNRQKAVESAYNRLGRIGAPTRFDDRK